MKKLAKYLLLLLLSVVSIAVKAQDPEMADTFRADGKIYVVVLIILIVLIGLITYLFLMDRKLSKIEKLLKEKLQTK